MEIEIKKKVLLMGDAAVGKTSLVRRFVLDKFDDRYITTIGAKVMKKEMGFRSKSGENMLFSLLLWDMLGQKGYERIQKASFNGGDGALLVCDLTRPESLQSLETYWIPKLEEVAGKIPLLIMANKCDLPERQITNQDLVETAARHRAAFFLTSAKTGQNVNAAFYKMAFAILTAMKIEAELGPDERPEYKPSLEEKDSYTAVEVADMIMTDFCASDEVLGIDGTMEILVPQFDRAGVDVKNPTKEGLTRVVNNLAEMEGMMLSFEDLEERRARRMSWVERIVE
ncbi:MAG: GTP-binding protein [Candidatus Thermoplasmatota archaeon]|nr:GTP-binding protein [Candidatus Thermoplasmatota archaeon]